MNKRMLLTILLLVISFSVKAQYIEFAGIWQDSNNPNKYYSIQVNENRMVLIDLPGLEVSGNTLFSSFIGEIAPSNVQIPEARLKVLVEHQYLPTSAYIALTSTKDLYISWGCGAGVSNCIGLVQKLSKIF
jgi:hypothetical protein